MLLYLRKIRRVRVIAKRTLRDFWLKHTDTEQQLTAWFRETEKANWSSLNEMKNEYPSASILKDNRVIFNKIIKNVR